jgi:heme-degrading monooxygenase HmoA
METAAGRFPGYLGIWSTRGSDGIGITISYWDSEAAARAWKDDSTHTAVREQGRARWYDWYEMVVAEVTRGYDWKKPGASQA